MLKKMKSYDAWYVKITRPFKENNRSIQVLRVYNRSMTVLMPLVYLGIFVYLFRLDTDFSKVWKFIWVPALGFVLLSFFRKIFRKPRPYEVWEIDPLLVKEASGNSFPSRHVFSATMISMCVLHLSLPLGMFFLFLSILLAVVRVIGGVHFPKDVIVGWIWGLVCGILLSFL